MATFSNQATLLYGGVATSSNIVTGELLDALAVTKTAVIVTYRTGDTLPYVVTLRNTSGAALTGITVTDTLGAYPFGTGTLTPLSYVTDSVKYFVNGELVAPPTVASTAPLTFTGLSLPAGGEGYLVYAVTVNDYAPLGADGSVTNTATVTYPGLVTPLSATATVTAADGVSLNVKKAVTPATVTEGDSLTYTITVENYGLTPVTAEGGALISDTFDPILSLSGVSFNGQPLSEGTGYTYNGVTGEFATLPGVLTVPAATAVQDPITGAYTLTPGVAVLSVGGTV